MDKQVSRNEEIIPPALADEETKLTIRKKVWECFSNHRLITFPKPHGRIPNFIGIEDTTMNLTKLPEFIGAKSVAVFIDKALTSARELVLENSKDLYVPFPRFQRCLMKKIVVNESDDFKTLVSRGDIHRGENVGISDGVTVDMLIVGSVAVSKEGYRIGRGRGFEDLEYGLFKEYKAVNDDTVIVTIVHDLQVFDSLPRDLFEKYDTPVDVIITPTRTIIVENKLPKPPGIFWNELNVGQVKSRKLLQILYAEHKKSQNRDTTLSKENGKGHRPFYWRRYSKKETKNPVEDPDANRIDQNDKENQKKKRRGSGAKRNKGEDDTPRTEESYRTDETDRSKRNEKRRRNFRIDYSLKVTNINKKMRTRDFVKALKERNIKPRCITWKGKRGVCYLHYVKKDRKKDEDVSDAINDVIEIIQDLKLDPDEPDKNLNVKVVEPITRIETVDVTAV